MKVYIVEIDNGMQNEDYSYKVKEVFKNQKSAEDSLLDMGFQPQTGKDARTDEVFHYFEKENKKTYNSIHAWISEFELKE